MPVLDIPKPYDDGEDLTEAMLDTCFESIETFVNTTKLDSDNIAAGAVGASQLATSAVEESKVAANAISLQKLAEAVVAKLVPTGSVLAYGGTSEPAGYLMCNGTAISRTTYSALFGVIGTKHGTGDGSTTFNLPDYRGRFLRGADSGTARDPDAATRTAMNTGGAVGDNVGSIQGDATQAPNTPFTVSDPGAHEHFVMKDSVVTATPLTASNYLAYNRDALNDYSYGAENGGTAGKANVGRTSDQGAHTHTVTGGDNETRPVNANVNFIIKV